MRYSQWRGDNCTDLGSEATRTADAMKVGVLVLGHVVVNDDIDALEVDTTAKEVGGDHDAGAEVLELLVGLNAGRR